MKKIVSFGMKVPVPGVAYSNMESYVTLEGDSTNGDDLESMDKKALKLLANQMEMLVKEANEIVEK